MFARLDMLCQYKHGQTVLKAMHGFHHVSYEHEPPQKHEWRVDYDYGYM